MYDANLGEHSSCESTIWAGLLSQCYHLKKSSKSDLILVLEKRNEIQVFFINVKLQHYSYYSIATTWSCSSSQKYLDNNTISTIWAVHATTLDLK